ncbi:MAG: hypothetical protein AB1482_12000 [Pseudomonadota bacterium]
MSTEKLGVRVANPEQTVILVAGSFAELLAFEHVRAENLKRCAAALALEPGNEIASEVAAQLQAMGNSTEGVLRELLRIAREQGVYFDTLPRAGEVH